MKMPALVAAICWSVSTAAQAQIVYRCGSSYSQTPCPSGRGKMVEATDPRSAAQRAEALRLAAAERRLASEMERDRLADEAVTVPRQAASLGGDPPAPTISAAARSHHRKRWVRRAVDDPRMPRQLVDVPGKR